MDIHHFFIEDKILREIDMTHREIGNFRESYVKHREIHLSAVYILFLI
jgi:hypothetical protein